MRILTITGFGTSGRAKAVHLIVRVSGSSTFRTCPERTEAMKRAAFSEMRLTRTE
jgi:hypothetical protein